MLNDENLDWAFGRFEFQAELPLHGGKVVGAEISRCGAIGGTRPRCIRGRNIRLIRGEGELEIKLTSDSGLINNRAAKHRRKVTGKVRHGRARPILSQRERVQGVSALNAHVLLSVHHISHRAGRNRWPEVRLPQ